MGPKTESLLLRFIQGVKEYVCASEITTLKDLCSSSPKEVYGSHTLSRINDAQPIAYLLKLWSIQKFIQNNNLYVCEQAIEYYYQLHHGKHIKLLWTTLYTVKGCTPNKRKTQRRSKRNKYASMKTPKEDALQNQQPLL